MNIAILGATSQIAKDLIISFEKHTDHHCILFSRSPVKVQTWAKTLNAKYAYASKGYDSFASGDYDAIINFVGVGDPARAKEMGAKIFDITYQYDQLALDYIQENPECKYIFLSSGAVYGDVFSEPVNEHSMAKIPMNRLDAIYYYTISKLHAEARHRALSDLSIVDVRVFNYFSHTQDLSARFLMTDIVRAIQNNTVLKTSPENIVRDFLNPEDFFQLIQCVLNVGAINQAVDCYSKEPIDKISLLGAMESAFNLRYETVKREHINATGFKTDYYSLNRVADILDYFPKYTSLEGILSESKMILRQ